VDLLLPPPQSDRIRRRLLRWFTNHARDLPWRQNRDPYRIWISEVMLQQTQVATVISYFARFLERFPHLPALAHAQEQDVLRVWAGLGYYRRARDLWHAARLLHDKKHETIPDDPELLSSLPGFGRYTVNAVLSQAYERRLPILEANSRRVLCRLFGVEDDPQQAAVQTRLWQLAETLLPRKNIGAFNQAVMELGALLCTPTKPDCAACPLRNHCEAHRLGRQEEIPHRAKSPTTVSVNEVAIVLRREQSILLVQRPAKGRWAKMWECPHHPIEEPESPIISAQRLLAALAIEGDITGEIATIRHAVTRFQITMVCLEVAYRGGSLSPESYPNSAWVPLNALCEYPLSAPQKRLAQCLLDSSECSP
jgi:A/G-specific adenine glycosylase